MTSRRRIDPGRSTAALRIDGLRKSFGDDARVRALDGVDLDVARGSITAVLGPSGCGKTTLLRLVAGVDRPDGGRVVIGEVVVVDAGEQRRGIWVPPERRRVGLVPQEGALFPHLDVAGNVAFGIRSRSRDDRRARVEELLSLVELDGYGQRRPHELSGGQRQRVALARALAPEPEVVLMDEPFSALDATLRAALRDEVAGMLRRSGTTAVIVTHDRTEAMALADRVAVMRDGRIIQEGAPEDLYLHPVDEWTGRFLGDAVTLPGTHVLGPSGSTVECALGTLEVADARVGGGEVTVFLRPEQIVRSGAAATSGGVSATPARIAAVQFLGPEIVVGLIVGDVAISARWSSSSVQPTVGDVITIRVIGTARILQDSASTPC